MIASLIALIDRVPSAYLEIKEFLRVVSFELGLSTSVCWIVLASLTESRKSLADTYLAFLSSSRQEEEQERTSQLQSLGRPAA
jgi:hypothetical protein